MSCLEGAPGLAPCLVAASYTLLLHMPVVAMHGAASLPAHEHCLPEPAALAQGAVDACKIGCTIAIRYAADRPQVSGWACCAGMWHVIGRLQLATLGAASPAASQD